jgi:fucose permease
VLSGYWIFGAFIDSANPAALGWLNVYWLLAAVSLAILLLVAISPLDESAAHGHDGSPAQDIRAMVALLARPAVGAFVVGVFIYVLIEQGVGTWLPTFNAQVLHLPAAMSVQAASIYAAALALGRLCAGGVIRLVGWLPVLAGCIIGVCAIILFIVPLAHGVQPRADMGWLDAPFAAYAMPLIGLFLAPIYPTINSAILSSLPKARHAAMTGLIIAFSALGGTFGSFVTGHIFAALGGARAFSLLVVPAVLLGAVLFLFHRLISRNGATE